MDLEDQYDKLYRYCYFRVRDVQTAEDLVQETFLRWLDHYPGQREREALPTLYTIARNVFLDQARRKRNTEIQLPRELPDTAGGTLTEETDQVAADPAGTLVERWDLERALETLTPQDQELLLLRYANQVPLQALSRLTGLSRFAIYRRCGRLLTQLREALREEERT